MDNELNEKHSFLWEYHFKTDILFHSLIQNKQYFLDYNNHILILIALKKSNYIKII